MPRPESEAIPGRKHILETLEFIMNNSEFAGLPTDQIRFVSSAYSKLKETGNFKWSVDIPQLEIPIENEDLKKHNPTLLIGGVIEGHANSITRTSFSLCITFTTELSNSEETINTLSHSGLNVYSCCITHYQNKKRIVRRFHFDFQPASTNKPTSHIQYGGEFPEDDHHKDCHYCLEHFLENPRIHFPPMDLVLLFDLIIREFETPLAKWIQEHHWRHLVFESQQLWWKDYWNKSAGHINNRSKHTFHELIYGEAIEP